MLLKHIYRVGSAANHQTVLQTWRTMKRGLSINLLLLWWTSIPVSVQPKNDTVWQNRVVEGIKGIICKAEYCTAAISYFITLDPLKLPGDPLKVVAGSPRDFLKILANGSPGILFRDYSSAFSTIISHKLFNKLRLLNGNTQMCKWILDFLLNRTQVLSTGTLKGVCFLPYCSHSSPVTAGPVAAPLWYSSSLMIPPLKDW